MFFLIIIIIITVIINPSIRLIPLLVLHLFPVTALFYRGFLPDTLVEPYGDHRKYATVFKGNIR